MKLKVDLGAHAAQNIVKLEPDGTVFSYFGATGYLKNVMRTRFANGTYASSGSFVVSEAKGEDRAKVPDAPYGLMFVSEVDGVEKLALVERFATSGDAKVAFSQITRALLRRGSRARVGAAWRSSVLWIGAPLLAFIVGMSAVRYLDSHNGAMDMLRNLLNTPTGANMLQPSAFDQALKPLAAAAAGGNAVTAFGASVPSITIPPTLPVQRPQAPDTTAMSSIPFGLAGQVPRKVLYVYSDPNCPACRRFEPHLKDLSRDFEIHVLPVAYQDGSLSMASKILCSPNPKTKWSEVMDNAQTGQPVVGGECEQGDSAIQANMQTFDRLGFNQTPRVVSGTGYIFPAGATANDIRAQATHLSSPAKG